MNKFKFKVSCSVLMSAHFSFIFNRGENGIGNQGSSLVHVCCVRVR